MLAQLDNDELRHEFARARQEGITDVWPHRARRHIQQLTLSTMSPDQRLLDSIPFISAITHLSDDELDQYVRAGIFRVYVSGLDPNLGDDEAALLRALAPDLLAQAMTIDGRVVDIAQQLLVDLPDHTTAVGLTESIHCALRKAEPDHLVRLLQLKERILDSCLGVRCAGHPAEACDREGHTRIHWADCLLDNSLVLPKEEVRRDWERLLAKPEDDDLVVLHAMAHRGGFRESDPLVIAQRFVDWYERGVSWFFLVHPASVLSLDEMPASSLRDQLYDGLDTLARRSQAAWPYVGRSLSSLPQRRRRG